MAINVQTEFLDSTTVRIIAYVYNDAGSLADATGLTIDIYDPDGTLTIDGGTMDNQGTGVYDYYYHKGATTAAMATGRWRGVVLVTDGSGATAILSQGTFSFLVR